MAAPDRGPEYRRKVENIKRNMAAAAGRRDPKAHVMILSDTEWAVKLNGHPIHIKTFSTREEAWAFARTLPNIEQVVVHNEQGGVALREAV